MAGNGPKIELSLIQVATATLAAVSAAAAASFLGVAGTIGGAAVVSTVASLAQAVYGPSLRRGRERIKAALPVTQAVPTLARRDAPTAEQPPVAQDRPTVDEPPPDPVRSPGWRRFTAVAALVFGLALTSVTVIEVASGKPFSALFGGSHQRGSTLSHVVGGSGSDHHDRDHRTPSTPTPSRTGGGSSGPGGRSGSPSTAPSAGPSGGSPSPEPSHSPTGEPTPSPSGGAPTGPPTQAPTGGTVQR